VLPGELIVGLGMGLVMAPAMNYATHGVRPEDAGIASATVNTSQQIGGSIGTALLNTVATSATADYLADRARTGRPSPRDVKDGLVEGFADAYTVASVVLVVAAVIVAVLMNTPRPSRAGTEDRAGAPAAHLA
jgi:hypothetical protein